MTRTVSISCRSDASPARRRARVGRALAPLALLLLAVGPGVRGAESAGVAGVADEALAARIARHDRALERRVVGLWGAGISEEQVVSGSIGVLVARIPESFDCATTCEYSGPFAKLEPGLGAGKLSVGHARLVGEQRGHEHFLAHVFFGYGIKASVMRTWSERSSEPPGQTWLGVEADVTAVMVRFSLGLFHHVSGDDDNRWLVSAGVGWGF